MNSKEIFFYVPCFFNGTIKTSCMPTERFSRERKIFHEADKTRKME